MPVPVPVPVPVPICQPVRQSVGRSVGPAETDEGLESPHGLRFVTLGLAPLDMHYQVPLICCRAHPIFVTSSSFYTSTIVTSLPPSPPGRHTLRRQSR